MASVGGNRINIICRIKKGNPIPSITMVAIIKKEVRVKSGLFLYSTYPVALLIFQEWCTTFDREA
jgi:hypothetical protein